MAEPTTQSPEPHADSAAGSHLPDDAPPPTVPVLEGSGAGGPASSPEADTPSAERPAVIPGPSFWDVLGRGVRAAGRGISSAVQAVDADVR